MAPLDALAAAAELENIPFSDADALNARYGHLDTTSLIRMSLNELFSGRVAMVSSFGAESAVLLHLLATVDRSAPVIFLDTGRLFAETLEYRSTLVERLGLRDVRTYSPEPERLATKDPHRALWMTNPDLCCQIRKTEPLQRALADFDAWFTGRKRFQNSIRADLKTFEADAGRIKINPLAGWSSADLKAYARAHDLPEHPLVGKGYPSIGCVPCTTKVLPGEDERSGRWRGLDKTECGIHVALESDGSGI